MKIYEYDVFLMDLDGVIYLGDQVLPGSRDCIERLRELGKKICFLTNDPRPTRQELCERLQAMQITAVPEEIITSGWATAAYLAENNILQVFVIGSEGLINELTAQGIRVNIDDEYQAVIIGYDKNATFYQMQQAVKFINKGARFIATNTDTSFPGQEGRCLATGAIVEAVQAACEKKPIVIGKPSSYIFKIAMQLFASGKRAVMIGDNPETDILGAHQMGIDAILVSKEHCPHNMHHDYRTPDAVIENLMDLFAPQQKIRHWQNPGYLWPESVKAGVAAVVFNEQHQILLVKRKDNGLWSLPSGHVEIAETVTEAIIRELEEETGLTIAVPKLIGVYSDPLSQVFTYPTGSTTHFITLCFLCRVIGGYLQVDNKEIAEAIFFDLEQLPKNIMKMHPQWLADALSYQDAAYIR